MELRRERAAAVQENRKTITDEMQLELIKRRPGESKREKERLEKRIAAKAAKPEAAPKEKKEPKAHKKEK